MNRKGAIAMQNNNFSMQAQQLMRRPEFQDPFAQSGLSAIANMDVARGVEIADNICRSYGLTREQMLQGIAQTIIQKR